MRTALLIILIALFHLGLSGQSAEEKVISIKQHSNVFPEESMDEDQLPETGASEHGTWNLSVGTSFLYSKGFGSGMSFYAAPTYSFPLNQRWTLYGGMMASQYQGLSSSFAGESMIPGSYTSMALFVAGSYQMNDRLVIHGTGVKQLLSTPVTPFTPYPMDHLSLGATYRLGNNITIGASIHMNNGRGYYTSPWNGTMFPSPVIW